MEQIKPNHDVSASLKKMIQMSPDVSITELKKADATLLTSLDPNWTLSNPPTGSAKFPMERIALGLSVRNFNREMFHAIEGAPATTAKAWPKVGPDGDAQGGGVITLLRGQVIEKSGVNWSAVWGPSYPSIEKDYAGKSFTATGVSLICHPRNPNAPIAHMNVRMLTVGEGKESLSWIGGGADLTPMIRFEEDTRDFHQAMKDACSRHRLGNYEKFRDWCDEYFYIPHYKETRGVGGIFFDYLPIESETDLNFLIDVGRSFAKVYGDILSRRVGMDYTQDMVEKHHRWRGRYAEFNLVYDRGTRFGLMSGGNPEAIFASLPPVVKW